MDKQFWYIYALQCYLEFKWNQSLIYSAIWKSLRNIKRGKTQKPKITFYLIPCIGSLRTDKPNLW